MKYQNDYELCWVKYSFSTPCQRLCSTCSSVMFSHCYNFVILSCLLFPSCVCLCSLSSCYRPYYLNSTHLIWKSYFKNNSSSVFIVHTSSTSSEKITATTECKLQALDFNTQRYSTSSGSDQRRSHTRPWSGTSSGRSIDNNWHNTTQHVTTTIMT